MDKLNDFILDFLYFFRLYVWSLEINNKESLILFENHAVLNRLFLVEIIPGSICTLFSIMAVFQHPIAILVFDGRLHFWYQLVVDSNVRVWRSAYDEFLLFILADDNVGVLQIIWWEDFQLQLVGNVRASLTWLLGIFIVIARLVTDQVWDDVGFSDVAEEAVSNNDGALKFGESTIAFSQISDFVLSVERIELDIKLPSLVVVPASKHRICRWLLYLLASIRIVRVCSGNDEVVHLFF